MRAFAGELKSTPKQDYSQAWSEPKTSAPPPPDPKAAQPGGTAPVGDAGQQPEGEPKGEGSAKETARVVLMMYDNLVSQVCSAIADHESYPAKRFAMDEASRREAEKQLAIGIEKNNWAGLPWWGILVMMIVASGVANWLLVREAMKDKRKQKEQQAARNRASAARGEPLNPDSITDKHGQTVKPPAAASPVASPAHASTDPASPPQASPARAAKFHGSCQECGNPVKHKGRKYCSQSCAGKATAHRTPAPTA